MANLLEIYNTNAIEIEIDFENVKEWFLPLVGYVSDEPEFGNTFSAQSLLPSYDASPRGEGRQNTGGKKGGGGGRPGGKRGGGGQQRTDGIDMLRKSVPGVPGQDYPIYGEVPETSFSCNGQVQKHSNDYFLNI